MPVFFLLMKSDLESLLKTIKPSDTVLVGIGNTLKGDDGAGSILAERLRMLYTTPAVQDAGSVPENYIGKVITFNKPVLIFIDVLDFKGMPGEVKIFSMDEIYDGNVATHSFSIGFLADLIRSEINCTCYLLGIQPVSMKMGDTLSEPVQTALDEITALISGWAVQK